MGEWPRPCPIPGHPHDDDAVVVTESAWARLRRWHLHAPAERLPLPAVLLTWPAAWVLHGVHIPGHLVAYAAVAAVVLAWLARHREAEHPRLAATEAAIVTAIIGAWVTA